MTEGLDPEVVLAASDPEEDRVKEQMEQVNHKRHSKGPQHA